MADEESQSLVDKVVIHVVLVFPPVFVAVIFVAVEFMLLVVL